MTIDDILKSRLFALEKHKEQKRKYTGEPYFNHCHRVAQVIADYYPRDKLLETYTGNEMIMAAYLHDTVEDCGVTFEEIEKEFSPNVRELVEYLTSNKSITNRKERKADDRKRYASAPPEAQTIKLADILDNTADVDKMDPGYLEQYMGELLALIPYLSQGDEDLWDEVYHRLGCGLRLIRR